MIKIYFLIITFCFLFLLINCPPLVEPKPQLKSYDSIKAGAEIIESYDIGSIIEYDSSIRDINIHFSEYKNNYYVIHNEKIFILDKKNLRKIKEIHLNLSSIYNNLKMFSNRGIVTFDNKILFSYYLEFTNYSNKSGIFQLDLSGDNFIEKDISSDFNIKDNFSSKIGYNRKKQNIWLLSGTFMADNKNKYKVNEYSYDVTNDKYFCIFSWDYNQIVNNAMNITDDIIWISYLNNSWISEYYIEKYEKNNQNIKLKTINVLYLGGTLSTPEDILFDDPYLWIIINKDNKMQLLKLKPL